MKTKDTKNKRNVTELSAFSPEHQALIVKLMIEDEEFKLKAMDLIDVNALNADECIRRIASIAKELYSKGAVFTYRTIRIYIDTKISDEITKEKCLAYLDQWIENAKVTPADLNFIKERVYPIITFQEIRRMYGELKELVDKQICSKDEVERIYRTFNNNTSFTDCSYEDLDCSIEAAARLLEEDTYEYIPTSSKVINLALGGGLRKGDVGLLLAGSGVAKTCMTTSFVCWNAYHGRRVAHFVLEDKKDDILKKYMAFVTNIGVYRQPQLKDEVLKRLDKQKEQYTAMLNNIKGVFATKNNGKIKVMSTKDIDHELEVMVNNGFVPDMVVVDYYDRIRKFSKEIWLEDERIINELLEIATKYNVALWLPTQGGKAAQNPNAELDASSASGGAYKTYGAQTFISVQKRDKDFKLSILKSRHYPGNKELTFEFDNGTCRFVNEDNKIRQMNETNECIDDMFNIYAAQQAKAIKNNNKTI